MKKVKMLRTVEDPDGKRFDGDSVYTFDDNKADALIADGSADLIEVIAPPRREAPAVEGKKEDKKEPPAAGHAPRTAEVKKADEKPPITEPADAAHPQGAAQTADRYQTGKP